MVQSVMHLLQKHEDLSLIPRIHVRKVHMTACFQSYYWVGRDGNVFELWWPESIASLMSSRSMIDPISKNKVDHTWEKNVWNWILTSLHLSAHAHTQKARQDTEVKSREKGKRKAEAVPELLYWCTCTLSLCLALFLELDDFISSTQEIWCKRKDCELTSIRQHKDYEDTICERKLLRYIKGDQTQMGENIKIHDMRL